MRGGSQPREQLLYSFIPCRVQGRGGVPPLHQELQDKAAVFTGQNK